jgi:hypothetical protein
MDASLVGFDRLSAALLTDRDRAIVAPDATFSATQLHQRSRFGWAVIGSPSGAIASTKDGELLLRLRKDEAEQVAAALTQTATRATAAH